MMEHRKVSQVSTAAENPAIERRFVAEKVEYRAVEGSEMGEVFGYALKWGVEYDMGWYVEKIDRHALDNADMSDIRVLDNHTDHLVLGRTKSGTATVGMDEVGVWYRAKLPNSPNGQNMRESLSRGDIDQSSWSFSIRADATGRKTGEKWEIRGGREIRTITDVAVVYDTSPVTFPANPDTSAAKRSRDTALGEERAGSVEKRKDLESWDIGWMMENVAWATYRGNDMVTSLNNCIANYTYYAEQDSEASDVFKMLVERCAAAKEAIVGLIDGHVDALKVLNASENRADDGEQKETRKKTDNEGNAGEGEQKTNTNNAAELLEMDIELLEAEMRAKKSIKL